MAFHLCVKYFGAILVSGSAKDIIYAIKAKQDAGVKIRIVIWDVPRESLQFLSWKTLEQIKNRICFSAKYESGQVILWDNVHILCFANELPDWSKLSLDRWQVEEVVDGELVRREPYQV